MPIFFPTMCCFSAMNCPGLSISISPARMSSPMMSRSVLTLGVSNRMVRSTSPRDWLFSAPTRACASSAPVRSEVFPVLARGAALRFALTRLVDWLNVPPNALVHPKDPLEYVRKLRFHQPSGTRANSVWCDERRGIDLDRRGLFRQSRSRRLGRDPLLRRT